jgi:hypothetical protein
MNRRRLGALAVVLGSILPAAAPLAAQSVARDSKNGSEDRSADRVEIRSGYFYHGLPFGSDAYLGPIDVLLNKGFNMSQAANRDRRIFGAAYGARHVRGAVFDPFGSVERSGGWGTFLREQILPIQAWAWIRSGFDWGAADNMTWYPNYFGHLIEGGISSRRLAEKLREQGVPYARLFAGATTMAAAVINEMYTHPTLEHGTGATVADLYIFDLGGVLLFSSDAVARFFSEKLHASVWSSQASLTLPSGELANNANNLVFKLPIPFVERASFFVRTAVGSHVGATLHLDGYDLSLGVGADTHRQNIDPISGHETVDIRPSASLYLDRQGSLLASLYWSQVDHRLLTLNVYPGVLHDSFGAWVLVTRDEGVQLGISSRSALGLGIGADLGR